MVADLVRGGFLMKGMGASKLNLSEQWEISIVGIGMI